MTSQEFRAKMQRIEELVGAIESAADPNVRASAVELVTALMDMHGAGVERMLDVVFESGPSGAETIDRLASDELVASLLLLYDLHPVPFETRVLGALDRVRPSLKSHGGDVVLLGTDGGVVRLRIEGTPSGCGSTASTLEHEVEEAVYDAAPDLVAIEVENALAAKAPALVRLGRARRADVSA